MFTTKSLIASSTLKRIFFFYITTARCHNLLIIRSCKIVLSMISAYNLRINSLCTDRLNECRSSLFMRSTRVLVSFFSSMTWNRAANFHSFKSADWNRGNLRLDVYRSQCFAKPALGGYSGERFATGYTGFTFMEGKG